MYHFRLQIAELPKGTKTQCNYINCNPSEKHQYIRLHKDYLSIYKLHILQIDALFVKNLTYQGELPNIRIEM